MSDLRSIAGCREVDPPSGAATTTRLRTTPGEDDVLGQVAVLVGSARRADLRARTMFGRASDPEAYKAALAARKREMTADLSSRWAGSITRANNTAYALAARNLRRHQASLQQAVAAIEARLAVECGKRIKVGRRWVRGYRDQAERWAKQQRLQHLRAELARVTRDVDANRPARESVPPHATRQPPW